MTADPRSQVLFPQASTSPARIISASRRTDLPGYHADECAARLHRLRKTPHTVFFWTRYPRGLIRPGPLHERVRHGLDNVLVHLTLTGLGGTRFEPRVPPTEETLANLDPLIETLGGDPRRVLWRFDPILIEAMNPATFEPLAEAMGRRGVRRCIISFPALMSLKGSLDPAYERQGLRRHGRAEKRELALRLAEIAARHGLTLYACCQPQLVQDAGGALLASACIDAALASQLHPRGLGLDLPKDPTQRRHCQCALSHDIGRYDDRCRSGCVYCYSRASDAKQPEEPV